MTLICDSKYPVNSGLQWIIEEKVTAGGTQKASRGGQVEWGRGRSGSRARKALAQADATIQLKP